MSLYDHNAVAAWVDRVYARTPGLLAVAHIDRAGAFAATGGSRDTHNEAVDLIGRLEQAGALGIYLRTTTLTSHPEAGQRGGAASSHALPGLWADIDLEGPGHKHDPARHDGRHLPADEDQARGIVHEAGLPAPSLWVHSGGGLYPWWLLDEPLILDETNRGGAAAVSTMWQQALRAAAARHHLEYGAGVGDLPRVLRVPGTVNRKAGLERPCRVIGDTGAAYTFAELAAAAARATPNAVVAPVRPPPRPSTGAAAGRSAFDELDEHVTFDDILIGAGWAQHQDAHTAAVDQCWTRPGDPDHACSAHTLTAMPEALVVHSEAAGLPTGGGQKLTRGRLFAHLHHHGDPTAAALDLFAAMGGRGGTSAAVALPLPRTPTCPPHADRRRPDHDPKPHVANTAAADDAAEAELAFNRAVNDETHRLRIREAARNLVDLERRRREPTPPFDAGTITEILARPADPPMRIDGLQPWEAALLVVAQRKAGKTTLELNYARALLTGEPFLGQFDVRPVTGTVAILNFEVSAAMLARWAHDAGINPERLVLVNLRGRRNPLAHPDDRAQLATYLRQRHVESLIVDPFGRAYTGQSQNDSGEVGAWLIDLDLFARAEVGATDLMLTAHAGWNGERSRGSSALEDWADAILTITRDPDDEHKRFMRAIGRDVEVDEDRLDYDQDTRTLTMSGTGSRRKQNTDRKLNQLATTVTAIVTANPGWNTSEVARGLTARGTGHQKGDPAKALRIAVEQGHLRAESGPRSSIRYYPTPPTPTYPDPPQAGCVPPTPTPPVVGGVGGEGHSSIAHPTPDLSCPDCSWTGGHRNLCPQRATA